MLSSNHVGTSRSARRWGALGLVLALVTIGVPALSQCVQPPSGIVAWYPLDEQTGLVNDIIGFNNVGTPWPGPLGGGGPNPGPGKVGGALGFTNPTCVRVKDHPDLDFGTGDFSIDAWIKAGPDTVFVGLRTIVDKRDQSIHPPARVRGYTLFISDGGQLGFQMADDGGFTNYISADPHLVDGEWHFVAVTVQRTGTVILYVDGVAVHTGVPRLGNVDNGAGLLIGRNHPIGPSDIPSMSFNGWIDELELFNRALSADEIQAIYKAGSAGKCKTMICVLKFEDKNGNGVHDPGEPWLPGWTFNITDANGNVVATITTAAAMSCASVPAPATYTVSEVPQTGWTQTFPPSPGTYTKTFAPDHVAILSFGNRRVEVGGCDLMIRKSVSPTPLVSGQQATVTITVTNVGTAPCPGPTTVTETVPPGLTLVSASGPGWVCVGPVCTYPLPIPVGGSVSVTYTFNVTAPPGSVIENCATVSNPNDQNAANNRACIMTPVMAAPGKCDLAIRKEVRPSPLVSGQQATVTITVTNVGTAPCPGPTTVTETVPPGLTLVSASGPGWVCVGPVCTYSAPIPAGGSVSVTYVFRVSMFLPGRTVTNCATVTNANDTNTANNRVCVVSTVK